MGPEIQPLKSLDDVEKWTGVDDQLCMGSVKLKQRRKLDGKPRTLICHDMAGGYLDDRFIQGVEKTDCYRFYHWNYIDTFVYFSHNFVTIPPPCWINAAHKHGVSVLGTFITEWDDGLKLCQEFLASGATSQKLADKLVEITKYYGFDGWLLNIENKVQEDLIPSLQNFVKCLTEKINIEIPHSSIIWYDSVIKTGELKWQNELNENNKIFWDACHSIFLNYCWKEENLLKSVEIAELSKGRHNVYVGIDVFGRGCPGGGGFNTREALAMIRKHDLSAAIFAQGWVYETLDKERFSQNENRFWRLIHDLCTSHILSGKSLATSFCQGFGDHYLLGGKHVNDTKWTNLSLQQLQPDFQCHVNKRLLHKRKDTENIELEKKLKTDDHQEEKGGTCELSRTDIMFNVHADASVIVNSTCVVDSPVETTENIVQSPTRNVTAKPEAMGRDVSWSNMDLTVEDSYIGGGCLEIKLFPDDDRCNEALFSVVCSGPSIGNSVKWIFCFGKLFRFTMPLEHDVFISYSYKCAHNTLPHHLEFEVSNKIHQGSKVVEVNDSEIKALDGLSINSISREKIKENLFSYNHCAVANEYSGWRTRCYMLSVRGMEKYGIYSIEGIRLKFENVKSLAHPYSFFLGQLQVIPVQKLKNPPSKIENIDITDMSVSSSCVSCVLQWTVLGSEASDGIDYFNIYTAFDPTDECILSGHSVVNSYALTELKVPSGAKTLIVYVQPVYLNGFFLPKSCCVSKAVQLVGDA